MSAREASATGFGQVVEMRRLLNDSIARAAGRFDGEGEGLPFDFYCECGDLSCKRVVQLTVAQYRGRRSGSVVAHETG